MRFWACLLETNFKCIKFLEKYLLLFTVLSGLASLGLLIAIGFNTDLSVSKVVMALILFVLFGLLPLYLLQHYFLSSFQRFAIKKK